MDLGLSAILLAVAIVLFLIGAFSDLHQGDFISCGLAVTAAALLVEQLGLGTRINIGGPRNTA